MAEEPQDQEPDFFASLDEEMAEVEQRVEAEFAAEQASTAELDDDEDEFHQCPVGKETNVLISWPFRITFQQGEMALASWVGARQGNVAAAMYLSNFVRAFLNDIAHHMAHAYEQVGVDASDHSSIIKFLDTQVESGLDDDEDGDD